MSPIVRRSLHAVMSLSLLALTAAGAEPGPATRPATPAWEELGGASFDGWKNIKVKDGTADIAANAPATFRYPDGPNGWTVEGFLPLNDSSHDWRPFYGLQFDVETTDGTSGDVSVTLHTPKAALRQEYLPQVTATVALGSGWQRVTLPWSAFGVTDHLMGTMNFIQQVQISSAKALRVKRVRIVRAPVIAVEAAVRGKAVEAGQAARYDVTLTNCTDLPQSLSLNMKHFGWDLMATHVEPATLQLQPGQSAPCTVEVTLPKDGIPRGGHETQRLQVMATSASGSAEAALEFITARDVERPSVLHTAERWEEIRDKVRHYDWARKQADQMIATADKWNVPTTPKDNYSAVERHRYVFSVNDFLKLPDTAYAWQLTRDKKYAEKVALFLRRLSDPQTGYPVVLASMNQGGPQEGECFQRSAIAYDAILDAGVLSAADKKQIEQTFRLYMRTFEPALTVGNVGNWSTSASTGALMCALAMGDLVQAQRYVDGPCGVNDYLSKGVMNDGWWWECSTSYNFWVAAELTQSALALQPWGIDLLHTPVPTNYSPHTIITPWALNPPYGINFDKWGSVTRPERTIKQLWDAVPAATDYRGVVFGMNDGHEEKVAGPRLELAYYVFRDPAYARLIQLQPERDLLYGVAELPKLKAPTTFPSSVAENIGYALLRSQTPHREPREQIQAVMKIGTQGGFHGHFDRTCLDYLARYGRNFWNPETIWYGYGNYMYKFFVQTSVAGNMVVVDGKQQEAVPSKQLLFYPGKMMQVSVQETNARWSDPPYGGMQYFPGDTFAQQMQKNQQSIPLVSDRAYGELGPMSDRVMQRRLAIVTDDYVLLADYLKGGQPHTFDNVLQMRSLQSFEAADKAFERHDAQYVADPHSAGQFITDCDWYTAAAPALLKYRFDFGKGADNEGTRVDLQEPGTLKVDVHALWPQKQEIMNAMPPETQNEQQWVSYSVTGDGKELAHGERGVWILGTADVDVPVKGLNALTLELTTNGGGGSVLSPEGIKQAKRKTLFWTNPRLVLEDGSEVPLTQSPAGENVDLPKEAGKDYYGGPIKIAGELAKNAWAAQPKDYAKPGLLHVDLAGKHAVRFKATLGGDFPFGDESSRRRVLAIRSKGAAARFLTILEPYESDAMIRSARAESADRIVVDLKDGRQQTIDLANLEAGEGVRVTITEARDGKTVRTESTSGK